jgi:hypothetical protein
VKWHYEIQHGPDGEAEYAWLYRDDIMIATLRICYAQELVTTISEHNSDAVIAQLFKALTPFANAFQFVDDRIRGDGAMQPKRMLKPITLGHFREAACAVEAAQRDRAPPHNLAEGSDER